MIASEIKEDGHYWVRFRNGWGMCYVGWVDLDGVKTLCYLSWKMESGEPLHLQLEVIGPIQKPTS